jgi:hypothetical protein
MRRFNTQRIDVAVVACRLPVRLLRLQLKLSRRLAEIARTCSTTIWRRQQRAGRNYHDVEVLATRSRSTRCPHSCRRKSGKWKDRRGLSAALYGEITLKDGRVQQSNFHDYRVLRMNESPAIEVHLIESFEAPGGVGEPATSCVMPALTNAVYAATGKRVRKLPLVTAPV